MQEIDDFFVEVMSNESQSVLLSYFCVCIGGAIYGAFNNDDDKIGRATYFLATTSLFLVSNLIAFAWLFSEKTYQNNLYWALCLGIFGAVGVAGYFTAKFAVARSKDSYGNGTHAWMAFVPLANLVLLFRGNKNKSNTNWKTVLRNSLSIVFGVFFVGIAVTSERLFNQIAEVNVTTINEQEVSLEERIKAELSAIEFPMEIDEVTTLTNASYSNNVFTYEYLLLGEKSLYSSEFKAIMETNICKNSGSTYLSEGVSLEYRYFLEDKELFEVIYIPGEEYCRKLTETDPDTVNALQ